MAASSVDADLRDLLRAKMEARAKTLLQAKQPPPEIHVCQSSTCQAHGSEAVLLEIEELAKAVGGECKVYKSGCLGACRRAPAALSITNVGTAEPSDPNPPRKQRLHAAIDTLEVSARIVQYATGRLPPTDIKTEKFAALRHGRIRQHARSVFHWNTALKGLAEHASKQPELLAELTELLALSGFPEGVGEQMPEVGKIDSYTKWKLETMVPVSRHSAVYSFSSKDLKRGTPHPRGRGRMPRPNTWHTTLLAEVGKNEEGPLPWIERDYTPISTAKDWERGKVDILIKIYGNGVATSWLHSEAPKEIWLSKPVRTLSVPGLATSGGMEFRPGSILLLLAGTGVVALPQILHHRDPYYKLGIATPRRDQLQVPVDAIFSFREDDVLCIPQIAEYCRGGEKDGVRNATLLLTAKNADPPIFSGVKCGDLVEAESALGHLSNARILRSRLTAELVAEAVQKMPTPCRVVVSGPDGFNSAAREMLKGRIPEDQVTVLSA